MPRAFVGVASRLRNFATIALATTSAPWIGGRRRLQKPFVRIYTEERERPMLLLVDQRASMFFGSAVATKSVIAAELAALSAWRALAVGDRVGALIFTDDEVVQIRPHRSRKNVLRICHELVKRNTNLSARSSAANPSLLNKALRQALTTAKHDHLVVLITDYYGDNPATHRLVTNLATHNDVLGLMVYDPLGIRMPPAEHLAATDGQQRLTFRSTERFNERFRKAFEDRAAHVQRQLRGSRIPMLPICSQESVVDQLRCALGARR